MTKQRLHQLSGHFSWGGRAVCLHKEPIVRIVESPAMWSHRKVGREFRIRKRSSPILHPVS